jgi:hypothetical protein
LRRLSPLCPVHVALGSHNAVVRNEFGAAVMNMDVVGSSSALGDLAVRIATACCAPQFDCEEVERGKPGAGGAGGEAGEEVRVSTPSHCPSSHPAPLSLGCSPCVCARQPPSSTARLSWAPWSLMARTALRQGQVQARITSAATWRCPPKRALMTAWTRCVFAVVAAGSRGGVRLDGAVSASHLPPHPRCDAVLRTKLQQLQRPHAVSRQPEQ